MSNLNLCQIIGRLGKPVEVKYLPSGKAVANFTVAVSEHWKDKDTNERKESTEWFSVVMFGRQAEVAGEFLNKGSLVYLAGKMKTRSWEKDGAKHYKTELHADVMQFLERRDASGGDDRGFDQPAQHRPAPAVAPAGGGGGGFDDSYIPFNRLPSNYSF